jgi:hypothetical protein
MIKEIFLNVKDEKLQGAGSLKLLIREKTIEEGIR